MTITNNIGIYIHIPFCPKKCRYCDFLSFSCSDERALSEYTEALVREIDIRANERYYRTVDTVYIGGGTPSILSERDISRIMSKLRSSFTIADNAEITIEVNPATASEEKFRTYLQCGINRMSIGIQSCDNAVLKLLGRAHDKNDGINAVRNAKKAGFNNISVDLIFGIPGQTMKMWRDSLRQCIFLEPQHISLYSLQIEEGTVFYDMVKEGTMILPDESSDRRMYHDALIMLENAGYMQYEISNAALAGFESRHNLKYWSYGEYLGLGLGASSYMAGLRFKNHSRMLDYLQCIKADQSPMNPDETEQYSTREEMSVFVFTGLRKTEGLSLDRFDRTFGVDFFDVYDPALLNRYFGYLEKDGNMLRLTKKGMDISNTIMAEFI